VIDGDDGDDVSYPARKIKKYPQDIIFGLGNRGENTVTTVTIVTSNAVDEASEPMKTGLVQFLRQPGPDATNRLAELAIRFVVILQRCPKASPLIETDYSTEYTATIAIEANSGVCPSGEMSFVVHPLAQPMWRTLV
jgi:hypothetical protein